MIQGSIDMKEVRLAFIKRRHEYADVYTYIFRSKEKISYTAGEYGHVRLFGMPEGIKTVREFSFASAPHEGDIWFGVDARSGSPYQKRLLELQPGEEVGLFKIKGHMPWPIDSAYSDVVMVAGGVGITPFRSQILENAHVESPPNITLIHVGKDEYLFRTELEPKVGEYCAIRRESLEETLKTHILKHLSAVFYVAGPMGFVETVNAILHAGGISAIKSDSFKGLED